MYQKLHKNGKKKDLFIGAYLSTNSITKACAKADISFKTYYNWKRKDPKFAEKLKTAIEATNVGIEDLVQTTLKDLLVDADEPKDRIGASKVLLQMLVLRKYYDKPIVEEESEGAKRLLKALENSGDIKLSPIEESVGERDPYDNSGVTEETDTDTNGDNLVEFTDV